jgi:hypothetical protein
VCVIIPEGVECRDANNRQGGWQWVPALLPTPPIGSSLESDTQPGEVLSAGYLYRAALSGSASDPSFDLRIVSDSTGDVVSHLRLPSVTTQADPVSVDCPPGLMYAVGDTVLVSAEFGGQIFEAFRQGSNPKV